MPLPSVQEDLVGLADTEASWSSELSINDTSLHSGHEAKHCDFRNRKFSNFPSHRGRGRGRVRGHGREVGRDLHISDGVGHVGGQFSGRRRNEGNLREEHHDRGRNERNHTGRNERNIREDHTGRNERNLREDHTGRNERNLREDRTGRNERNLREDRTGRNERNLREDRTGRNERNLEGQNNETRNKTDLIADHHSARRTVLNHSAKRNDIHVRGSQLIEKMTDTNLLEGEQHGRGSDTRSRDGKQFDRANDDSPLENPCDGRSSNNRSEKIETTRMHSSKGISRMENFSVPSRQTDTLTHDRPQSANRRASRGRRGYISQGSDRSNNRNPNPHCKVDYSGINYGARKTTECSGNRKGTSPASLSESPRDASAKCTPPGFQTCNRPPPGFGQSSVGS